MLSKTTEIQKVDRFGNRISPLLINKCYGGFSLSEEAKSLLQIEPDEYGEYVRHDENLISTVLELGLDKSSESWSKLAMVYVPEEFLNYYLITEYDGCESVNLDYTKYLMEKLDLILHVDKKDNEEKLLQINYIYSYVKKIQQEWSHFMMFSDP